MVKMSEIDTHLFDINGLNCKCSKCGWVFELPANQYQMIVVLRKRRKYKCPISEEMKQKYGFVTTKQIERQ